jgi:hypothetical protein
MFDDLREKTGDTDFFGEEADVLDNDKGLDKQASPQLFLGMTPIQRFVIAVMVLLMACVMGSFLLLVTEKVFIPFV